MQRFSLLCFSVLQNHPLFLAWTYSAINRYALFFLYIFCCWWGLNDGYRHPLSSLLQRLTFFSLTFCSHYFTYFAFQSLLSRKGCIGTMKWEKFEDIKEEQYNGQKKKEKRSNNDLQNTTQKTRDPTIPTPLWTGGERRCSGMLRVTIVANPVISDTWGKERIVIITNGRRVWRYQRGNQNPYIDEEQTTQWPKEKVQKDEQRSTKHTYKTKDGVTRTSLKTGGTRPGEHIRG